MKAGTKKERANFKPVTIEITFESEQEMRDFKSLFNYAPVCDFFRRFDLDTDVMKDAIPCKQYNAGAWTDFTKKARGK